MKIWLENKINIPKLKQLRGVGNKTLNYFKIKSGMDTCAVDRHLREFLTKAGILVNNDYEAKDIINQTAEQMGINKSTLDHSIWRHMSNRKRPNRLC